MLHQFRHQLFLRQDIHNAVIGDIYQKPSHQPGKAGDAVHHHHGTFAEGCLQRSCAARYHRHLGVLHRVVSGVNSRAHRGPAHVALQQGRFQPVRIDGGRHGYDEL